jgi:hypothetical protein
MKMTKFWKRLGDIIIECLTPSEPETFVGVVESITEFSEEVKYQYWYYLYIDNKGKRSSKITGRQPSENSTISTYGQKQKLTVEIWLAGGPLPERLNIDVHGKQIIGNLHETAKKKNKPVDNQNKPSINVEKEGNLIKFPETSKKENEDDK